MLNVTGTFVLCYNDLPHDKAIGCALERYAVDGRNIPLDYLYNLGDTPKTNFNKLLRDGDKYGLNTTGFAELNNDVPKETRAVVENVGGVLEQLFGETPGGLRELESGSQRILDNGNARGNDALEVNQNELSSGKHPTNEGAFFDESDTMMMVQAFRLQTVEEVVDCLRQIIAVALLLMEKVKQVISYRGMPQIQ